MSTKLDIKYKEHDKYINVQLNGEIDISTVTQLKEQLANIVKDSGKDVKLDLSDLTYIDSTGLGALVIILKKVKDNNKDIYLHGLKNNILKLFMITGLDKVFIIEE